MFALLVRFGHLVVAIALCVVGIVSAPLSHSARQSAAPPRGSVGHDVSAISCLSALPSGGSFGIIGATAGKPFHPSSCVASEYNWASGMTYAPQYYVNLADPGHQSSHWGHGGPRRCDPRPKYDVGCAYDYGYESAAAALSYVTAAGSTGQGRWWLDVEIDNSWGTSSAGVAANLADIKGALHYLRSRHHTSAGVYTETAWWSRITHSSRLPNVPVWGGGADSKRNARRNCRPQSITGGPALLAQWIVDNVDHDIAC